MELDGGRLRVRLPPRARPELDEGVRLFRAGGQDAARPVILERAADEPDAVRQKGGGERVARVTLQAAPVELEPDRAGAVDEAARGKAMALRHQAVSIAKTTEAMACVRVLRVTWSQRRQPAA